MLLAPALALGQARPAQGARQGLPMRPARPHIASTGPVARRLQAPRASPDPNKGVEPEPVSRVEPLEAAAGEVLFTAEQLAGMAADVASDASDVAAATQQAAQQAAADVASDAADVAASAQELAQQAAATVQRQAADAASNAADVVAAAAEAIAASAQAAGSQLRAPAEPAGSLSAPQPPAGSLDAPAPPAGSLQAPQPPAGALSAPQQPAGALPPPTPAAASTSPPPPASTSSGGSGSGRGADRADEAAAVKRQLISMLASLDRGAAATEDQAQRVDNLCRRLEVLGGPVALSRDTPGLALLDGRWRLLYSSGFTSGSLGGRRPGPSIGMLPLTLGPVYQDISVGKGELDNVVELFLRFSLASLSLPGVTAGVPSATARLRHAFSVIGTSTVEISFEATEVRLAGGLQNWLERLPMLAAPKLPEFLQPATGLRSARFDVVYLDEGMRITRGDRGELRVFLKGMV